MVVLLTFTDWVMVGLPKAMSLTVLLQLLFPAQFSETREDPCGPLDMEFCHVAEPWKGILRRDRTELGFKHCASWSEP